MKTVTLFRDFKEDHRTSMDVYADNLTNTLNNIEQDNFEFNSYTPHLGKLLKHLPEKANLKMRAARYISYPKQAKSQQGNINHIMDHGYAHLMTNLNPARTIITVHDIIPVLAGRGLIPGVTDQRKAHLAEWTSGFYKKAAFIIAISESTKNDLVNHCGCNAEKIRVNYFGINPHYKPCSRQEKQVLRGKLGLPKEKKLILITGDAFYKNQSTSLKVMEVLQKKYKEEIHLVRVGHASEAWNELVAKSPFQKQITEIHYLKADKMPEIYTAIDCLLFPSWYEGFGWPPVEAMACGTPAVTSNVASLPEAVGSTGTMKAPDDIDGLAASILRYLEDADYRNTQVARGLEHIKNFNWKKNASMTLDVYQELI